MRTKLEAEADMARSILTAMEATLAELDRWLPMSKRGVNLQRVLNDLEEKRKVAIQCLNDGLGDRK